MKHRVAICLFGAMGKKVGSFLRADELYREGEYINFNATYNCTKKHILDVNRDTYDIDFFLHGWNPDLETTLNEIYTPKKSKFEDNNLYKEEIQAKCKVPSQYAGISRTLSMNKSILMKEEYEKETNIEYHRVFLYRYDMILCKDINFNNFNEPSVTYMDSCPVGAKSGDTFFYMPNDAASIYKNLYYALDTGYQYYVHRWMSQYLEQYCNQMVQEIDIHAGKDYEHARKVNELSILSGRMTLEQLSQYGFTQKDIEGCCAGWNPVNGNADLNA